MAEKGEKATILIGALVGAACGVALAMLLGRWRRRRTQAGRKPLQPRQILRLASALVSVGRQFLDLIS